MTNLSARNLSIGHGGKIVAHGIDLDLTEGGVTCLLGPNGAGKTTLFRTLLGFIPALGGSIHLGDRDMARLPRAEIARHVAYVPQALATGIAHSVLDLVVMGRTAYLGVFGTPSRTDIAVATRALDMLGLGDLARRDTQRISGGQRQLAFIARALAQEARLIIMDEPTASLDFGNRLLVLDRVRRLADDGLAVLFSTHEPEQAFEIADQVAALDPKGQFQAGSVDTILTSDGLSRLYGVPLLVERTASGRVAVSRRPQASRSGSSGNAGP